MSTGNTSLLVRAVSRYLVLSDMMEQDIRWYGGRNARKLARYIRRVRAVVEEELAKAERES